MSRNVDLIRARCGDEIPEFAIILGSGLAHLADAVEGTAIPYSDLEGFPPAGVSGHVASMTIGTLEGRRVLILGGRAHYYEYGKADIMRPVLETLRDLGCDKLILTNATGSCRETVRPGDVLMVNDHINFSGLNPLLGEQSEARFIAMAGAYDEDLRTGFASAAKALDIPLPEGVYGWFSGPSFETPAEIRAAQIFGIDVVGMSTVPEIILGRYLGMRCAVLSAITNMGAGLSDEALSHEHTKAMAPMGAKKVEAIIRKALRDGLV